MPFFTLCLVIWTSCNRTQVVSNKLLWKQNKCEIYLAFQSLKKPILFKETSASNLKHQIAPYNSRFTFQKMTQTLSYLSWRPELPELCSSACALYVDTTKTNHIENTWENEIFPPSPWASTVLLHTDRIIPVSSPSIPLYISKVWSFSFLSHQKTDLFSSGCNQWKTIQGYKKLNVRRAK